jgi:hypothetical protein
MRKLLYIGIGISLLFSSCIKEQFDSSKLAGSVNFTPGIAVPIGYAHMTLQKYFNGSTANKEVIIDKNGFITLIYREKVFSLPAATFFIFHDDSSHFNLKQPGILKKKGPLSPTAIADTAYFQVVPQASNMQISSVSLNSGNIALRIENNLSLQGSCTVTFPGIYGKQRQITIDPLQPGTNIGNLDLTKDSVQFVSRNDSANFLKGIIDFSLNSPDNFLPNDILLGMDLTLSNVQYSVFYGYAGKGSIPINNGSLASFPLNFYQRLINGNFYFSDAKLKLLFHNSIGVPVELYFTDIYAITNGGKKALSGDSVPLLSNPRKVNYPSKPFLTAIDSIVFNSSNSNLESIMDAVPQTFYFSVGDSINYEGSSRNNFVADSSKLEADLQMELPLKGHTDSLLLIQDTLKFGLADIAYKNPGEVSFLIFQLNVTNGFPVEITPQIYFTDDKFQALDSLITDPGNDPNLILKAASVNTDGIVNNNISSTINVKFTPDRIQKIRYATHIITRGKIKSSQYPKNVKFLDTYYLDFNLGVIVQLQVNTGL